MERIRLYVRDVGLSAQFYSRLLGQEAAESCAEHAVFITDKVRIDLWVLPASIIVARQVDIILSDAQTVVSTYEALWDACVRLPQIPTDLGFGLGFVALDPDGHGLRVFCLNEAVAA